MNNKNVSFELKKIELGSLIEEIRSLNAGPVLKNIRLVRFLLEDIDDYLISKFAAFSELTEENIPKIVIQNADLEALYDLFYEVMQLEKKYPESFKGYKKMFCFVFYYSIYKYYQKQDEIKSLIEQTFLNRKISFERFVEVYHLKEHATFIDWYLDFYIVNRKEKIFLKF